MRQDFHSQLLETLTPIYGEREARNIAKLMLPDLSNISNNELEKVLKRLKEHEPWQYIIGKESFYGLEFKVSPHTLIPRPETEELVHLILHQHLERKISLLDIGTGTGCIPISIKKYKKDWKVYACDVSTEALEVAKQNAEWNEVEIDFFQTDILKVQKLPTQYDIIVSNPPYIPNKEKALMSQNVLEHEPHLALFVDDAEPLVFYDKIADLGLRHLKEGGYLYFELNEFYAKETQEMVETKGYQKAIIIEDLMGKQRILQAFR